MKLIAMIAIPLALVFQPALAHAQKSALDGFQFDIVLSDAVLKDNHTTRRQWLDSTPVPAREYWQAWDCKGKPCDSKWFANIRAKAALIPRTDKDPPPSDGAASSSH